MVESSRLASASLPYVRAILVPFQLSQSISYTQAQMSSTPLEARLNKIAELETNTELAVKESNSTTSIDWNNPPSAFVARGSAAWSNGLPLSTTSKVCDSLFSMLIDKVEADVRHLTCFSSSSAGIARWSTARAVKWHQKDLY